MPASPRPSDGLGREVVSIEFQVQKNPCLNRSFRGGMRLVHDRIQTHISRSRCKPRLPEFVYPDGFVNLGFAAPQLGRG